LDNFSRQGIIFSQDSWLNLTPAGTAVTAAYQYSGAVNISAFGQVVCYINFDVGAASGVNIKFQFGPDGTNWYEEEGVRSINGGGDLNTVEVFRQYLISEDRRIAFPVLDDWIRVGAQGIAGVDFLTTSCVIHLRVG
jgi:hypothetical protein